MKKHRREDKDFGKEEIEEPRHLDAKTMNKYIEERRKEEVLCWFQAFGTGNRREALARAAQGVGRGNAEGRKPRPSINSIEIQ